MQIWSMLSRAALIKGWCFTTQAKHALRQKVPNGFLNFLVAGVSSTYISLAERLSNTPPFTHVHLNLRVLEAAQTLPFSLPENAKL